jgi:hypothetical protein
VPEPPGGRWLVDERGLAYTLFRWRKHEGYYRLEDGPGRTVRLRHGLRLTVEHEDGEYLYLRWYRTGPARDPLAAAPAPAAEPVPLPERDALRLEPWDEGLPRGGQWRNGLAVADMNGDGHPDLVHGPPRKGPVTAPLIFLGDGRGRWRPWREARFPPLPYAYGSVAAGDLDGDGHPDLVLAAHLSGIFALRGDGAGGFTAWSAGLPVRSRPAARPALPPGAPAPAPAAAGPPVGPPAFTSRAVALADWNGDGRLDILALSEGPASPRVTGDGTGAPPGKLVFLNRGDGRWEPLSGPGAMLGDAIVPVDLDGDGRLDFVTDSRVVGSAEILNLGEPGGAWRVAALPGAPPRLRVSAVAVADLDGDGRRDLAVAYQSQDGGRVRRGLDVYFGTADGSGWRRVPAWADLAPAAELLTALAAGDLDGDGRPDLVALTARGEPWLLVNDGTGGLALDRSPEAAPSPGHLGCAGYAVAVEDLDGDGRGEVVATFAGEPGSEALVGAPARCRAGGAIRVWRVRRDRP